VIAALAREVGPEKLHTFSIAFDGAEFDESEYQQRMARHLGAKHRVVRATHEEIGRVFPEVIWHCETPILRTAPAPMFVLSSLVQRCGFKVVLTGEGADEMLGGYDIFKEDKIRRFWARQGMSRWRARLLKRLYPEIANLQNTGMDFLAGFFGEGLMDVDSPFYSHSIRWRNGGRARRFFSEDLLSVEEHAARIGPPLDLPAEFPKWGALERAQHLEITLFLSNYLLSSQGDRMCMAHAVEGRYPFLDFRVAEFCARLPARLKLRVLNEKYLLRQMAVPLLPAEIARRRKRPYRAPIHRAFFHQRTEDYVEEMLSPGAVRDCGLFKPAAVSQLVSKLKSGERVGETDDMALAGILSTQLLHHQFIGNFRAPAPLSNRDNVRICAASGGVQSLSYAF
jgi:asparagine synthase (glutamine-hydrolysing)